VASAKDERAYKAVLKLNFSGGAVPLGAVPQIETVFMAPKPGEWSACVSCQAGCPMGCAFCATGKMGFKRNLTAEEICGQVLFWRQWFKGMGKIPSNLPLIKGEKGGFNEFTHIVFMGMGEPGANWEAVAESLRAFLNPKIFGFGSRGISLSTCGKRFSPG
jgi:23S rRNA (adenine2503-C2)-methyltransferase